MSPYIYLLYFSVFLDLVAVGMVVPLIPGQVHEMGGSPLHIGALGSIYAGFQLVSGPLIGSLSDVKGRKTIFILSLLVSSAAYLCIGLTNSIVVILIMRGILGVFKQTQMLTRALVPDYVRDEQSQAAIYGKMAALSSAGMTLGPTIGGHISEDFKYGFTIATTIASICFVINAGLVLTLPNKRTERRLENSAARPESILQNAKHSLKQSFVQLYQVHWSEYWDVLLLKAIVGFAVGVYFSNYGIYLKTKYGLSQKYIGYMISFQGVIGSLTSFFIGYINSFYVNDKDYSLRNFHVFVILTMSLIGLILSFNLYVYTFCLIPFAVGNAVGRLTTLEVILSRSHGENRGTLIGASNSVRSLSGVVAPMVAGLINQYFGVQYVNYASLLAAIAGLSISYTSRSRKQKDD